MRHWREIGIAQDCPPGQKHGGLGCELTDSSCQWRAMGVEIQNQPAGFCRNGMVGAVLIELYE
jgi:hypothetical protein